MTSSTSRMWDEVSPSDTRKSSRYCRVVHAWEVLLKMAKRCTVQQFSCYEGYTKRRHDHAGNTGNVAVPADTQDSSSLPPSGQIQSVIVFQHCLMNFFFLFTFECKGSFCSSCFVLHVETAFWRCECLNCLTWKKCICIFTVEGFSNISGSYIYVLCVV